MSEMEILKLLILRLGFDRLLEVSVIINQRSQSVKLLVNTPVERSEFYSHHYNV